MRNKFSLSAVLMVRELREKAEERALAQFNAQANELRTTLGEIVKQLDRESIARLQHVHTVQAATHHLASEIRLNNLRRTQAEIRSQLAALEIKRREQQNRYAFAHGEREMLTDLQQQAEKLWEKDEKLREQKFLEDMFLARRKPARVPGR